MGARLHPTHLVAALPAERRQDRLPMRLACSALVVAAAIQLDLAAGARDLRRLQGARNDATPQLARHSRCVQTLPTMDARMRQTTSVLGCSRSACCVWAHLEEQLAAQLYAGLADAPRLVA